MLYPNNFPVPLKLIEETNSTNTYLMNLCIEQKETEELTTVVAEFQTAGRGQRGNFWESEPNQNLLFSFVFRPLFLDAKKQFLLSQIVSLAIKEELDCYIQDVSIKWPNDIYVGQKKICGILIEHDLMGKNICQSIAGIGININQDRFHSSAPNPVSLTQLTGKKYDALDILKGIMLRFQEYYKLLKDNQIEIITTHYTHSLFRKEGFYNYRDNKGEFIARIVTVEPSGLFVLEDDKGCKREYLFKEVEYIIIK